MQGMNGGSGSGGGLANGTPSSVGSSSYLHSPHSSTVGIGSSVGSINTSPGHAGGIPQPPPLAATPSLERHNSRSSLVRSSSMSLGGPGGGRDDSVTYWGNEVVGMSGLKNLGK